MVNCFIVNPNSFHSYDLMKMPYPNTDDDSMEDESMSNKSQNFKR